MIILAIGMPRAGSGWHYNYIKELMASTGCEDARDIREKYGLQKILTEVNCNIGVLSFRRLLMVAIPALLGHTFVIKAHSGPTIWLNFLVKLGTIRPLYIYRDPRDAMLSAHDYGRRVLEKQGRPNAFSHLTDFSKTMEFFDPYIKDWEHWCKVDGILITRYEDLLANFEAEGERIIRYLGLDPNNEVIQAITQKNLPAGSVQGKQGTHFFKGQVGRFREKYTAEELGLFDEKYGAILQKMEYDK